MLKFDIIVFFDLVIFIYSYVVCDLFSCVCVIVDLVFDYDLVVGCISYVSVECLIVYVC